MSPIESIGDQDEVGRFVLELLRTGVMLSDLAGDLIESLPEDAYPGEDNGEVILEMLIGSVRGVLGETEPDQLRSATRMVECAAERVIEHLRLALELRRRMDARRRGSD
jgi:hypothetical protein